MAKRATNAPRSPGPVGRPSKYSPQLAASICDAIIHGKSLRKICEADGMPNRVTVFRWLEQHADFATKYARARDLQAHFLDDLIQDTAETTNASNFQANRVKIGAYQWRASKLAPKKYGEKVTQELTGADGEPIKSEVTIDAGDAFAQLAAALDLAGRSKAGGSDKA